MVQGLMPLLQSNKLINPSLIIATCTQRILLNIKRFKVGKKSKNLWKVKDLKMWIYDVLSQIYKLEMLSHVTFINKVLA